MLGIDPRRRNRINPFKLILILLVLLVVGFVVIFGLSRVFSNNFSTDHNFTLIHSAIGKQEEQIRSLQIAIRKFDVLFHEKPWDSQSSQNARQINSIQQTIEADQSNIKQLTQKIDEIQESLNGNQSNTISLLEQRIDSLLGRLGELEAEIELLQSDSEQLTSRLNQLQLNNDQQKKTINLLVNQEQNFKQEDKQEDEEYDEQDDEQVEKMIHKKQNSLRKTVDDSAIVAIVVDLGSILERYARRTDKLSSCNEISTRESVERVEVTINSLLSIQESKELQRPLSIILSTTESRKQHFESFASSVTIVKSSDDSGYGDLSNAAVFSLNLDNQSLPIIFIYAGSIPTIDFIQNIIHPLSDPQYSDVGIVTGKSIDLWSGLIINCGTEVSMEGEHPVPHPRYAGYNIDDERTLYPEIVPSASLFGGFAMLSDLFFSIGGMYEDLQVHYTPIHHVYDICFAIAEESLHIDEDLEDDDNLEGVCIIKEKHNVLYEPSAQITVELSDCEHDIEHIGQHTQETVEFNQKWSKFLYNHYLLNKRETNITVVWDLEGECNEEESEFSGLLIELESKLETHVKHIATCDSHPDYVIDAVKRNGQTVLPDVADIWITYSSLGKYPKFIKDQPKYIIGRSSTLFNSLPKDTIDQSNLVDEIWVPFEFVKNVLVKTGVDESKIVIIPPSIDVYLFDPRTVTPILLPNSTSTTFKFLSIVNWNEYENWSGLLSAFWREFTPEDDVILYLYTPYTKLEDSQKIIDEEIEKHNINNPARVVIVNKLTDVDRVRLYKSVDCFLLPSHGEEWGINLLEAMAMQLPVIASKWGSIEEIIEDESWLIETLLSEKDMNEFEFPATWGEPSLDHLQILMRRAAENEEELDASAYHSRNRVINSYNSDLVAQMILDRIKTIEEFLVNKQDEE